jgi:hypothetical protein
MDSNKVQIIPELVQKFIDIFGFEKTLLIKYSNFEINNELSTIMAHTLSRDQETPLQENQFDLIFGNLPLGMIKKEWKNEDKGIEIKARSNWITLFKSLFLLSPGGYGLYVVSPAFWLREGVDFRKKIEAKRFFVKAALNLPSGFLQPDTSIQPNLVIIGKEANPKLFIAELDDIESIETIVQNFKDFNNSKSLDTGLFTDNNFRGFNKYKIEKEIDVLETQYKFYKKYQLKDIVLGVSLGTSKKDFQKKKNCVYFPKIGNSSVVSSLDNLKIKQQNYFQIELDENIVRKEYLELFFRSTIGELIRKSLVSETFIPHINKKELLEAYVSIPNIDRQKLLIATANNLDKLKNKIDIVDNDLAINPENANQIQNKLENIFLALDELSEADKIKRIIRSGESKTVEFKQTLSIDTRKDKKEKYIEKAALKTVVAFLNTNGGVLLVGVNDDKDISGIQDEIKKYHKNNDHFLLHFKNLIKTYIGEHFYNFIDYRIVNVDRKNIFQVICEKSNEPCYFGSKEFYVRTNPATDKLEGPKMVAWINQHFKK